MTVHSDEGKNNSLEQRGNSRVDDVINPKKMEAVPTSTGASVGTTIPFRKPLPWRLVRFSGSTSGNLGPSAQGLWWKSVSTVSGSVIPWVPPASGSGCPGCRRRGVQRGRGVGTRAGGSGDGDGVVVAHRVEKLAGNAVGAVPRVTGSLSGRAVGVRRHRSGCRWIEERR